MGQTIKVAIQSLFDEMGAVRAQAAMRQTAEVARKTGASSAAAIAEGGVGFDMLAGKARKGAKAIGFLSQSMGDEKGAAGWAAKTASGAYFAFATGGWIGLIVAAAATVGNHLMQMGQKADEAAKKMRELFYSGLIKTYENSLASLRREYDGVIKSIDNEENRLNSLAAVRERVNKAGNAVDAAKAKNMKALISAGYSTARDFGNQTPEQAAIAAVKEKYDLVQATNDELLRVSEQERNAAADSLKQERERNRLAQERLSAAVDQSRLAEDALKRIPSAPKFVDEKHMGRAYAETLGKYSMSPVLFGLSKLSQKYLGPTTEKIRVQSPEQWDKARKEAQSQLDSASQDVTKARLAVEVSEQAVKAAEDELAAKTIDLSTTTIETKRALNLATSSAEKLAEEIKRGRVIQSQINAAEEKIASLTMRVASLQQIADFKQAQRDAAAGQSALSFRDQLKAKRDAAREESKQNEREARWARNAQARVDRGTVLSKSSHQRLEDYQNWQQLKNRGGVKELDQAAILNQQLKKLEENLAELKDINANLKDNLRVRN